MHHGVRITDGAIVAAATLSDRYVTARFLPDKAIDLVDEAASRLRMEIDSRPRTGRAPGFEGAANSTLRSNQLRNRRACGACWKSLPHSRPKRLEIS